MSDAELIMQYDAPKKSVVVAYLFWFFVGPLGAHRFYLGRTGSAVTLLSLTVVCPFVIASFASTEEAFVPWLVVAVCWLIDFLLIPGITREYNSPVGTTPWALAENAMRPTNTLLILALCAGMLATGAASGQGETPLDVCGDDDRELAARADACWTAAEQGLAQAQYNLGLMYSKGHGVPQDYAKAVEWYRRAAEQGNATAQNNLGAMYDNGQGVPQDHAKAVEWYRRAAEQGNTTAQNNLGVMYDNGQGVPQDHAKAAEWFRRAAEQGNAVGQHNLGFMYHKGQGVPQDYAKAVEWYRRAAEQGYATAQNNLGVMYEKGQGVPQDYAKAAEWFRRAAERGYAVGQHNLGFKYHKGQGVLQDYAKAVEWFRRAAERRHADAQLNLGAMYVLGQGVPEDYVRAHMWYELAAANGSTVALKNRDMMTKLMTPQQLAEAQRMAREWVEKRKGK